ncbi:MAG: hypothetical protein ABIG11_03540 [bacterium]
MNTPNKRRMETVLKIPDMPDIRLRNARPEDMRRIQVLYAEVYGANYPMTIISDKLKMRRAIESDRYYWLVAECQGRPLTAPGASGTQGRIVGSLIYELDPAQRISKAFGAVVSRDYRKQNLANTMMDIILREITGVAEAADTVYATTRTVTVAPQQLTENLGFVKLGIFPNAHKVYEHETHCLAAYFVPGSLKTRKSPPVLCREIEPFYRIVQKQLDLEKPVLKTRSEITRTGRGQSSDPPLLNFEAISAPAFVKKRFAKTINSGLFKNTWVPFNEPNLLLITPDQSTEVYLSYGAQDRYSVITGGKTIINDSSLILKSIAKTLNDMGVGYIEFLVDAYSPELQNHALNARFLPSAYFPSFRKVGGKRWDYIVFSRSFEMLDFRNVRLTSLYRNVLKEYMKLWQSLYIEQAFRND